MKGVSRETVVRSWLEREWDKAGRSSTKLSASEAYDALLTEKPGAAAFFWRDAPVTCYRLVLSRAQFDRLHVVPGPDGLGWRALSPDGLIRGCARRIDRGDLDRLAHRTGIDVHAVADLTRESAPPTATEPLVLSTRRGAVPWHVADGNHRAVATALSLRRGASYEPRSAYLCVGANPVVRPFIQRLFGLLGDRCR